MKNLILAISTLLILTASLSFGDVPQLINYQGELTDTSGVPLTGSHALTFNIYTAATGGTHLWGPQDFSSVAFANGHFNVILGDANIASAFNGAEAYLQISVNGEAVLPRQQILSTPYAVSAQNAINAANAANSLTVDDNGNDLYQSSGDLNYTLSTIPSNVPWEETMSGLARQRTYGIDVPGSDVFITVTGNSKLALIDFTHANTDIATVIGHYYNGVLADTVGGILKPGTHRFTIRVTAFEQQNKPVGSSWTNYSAVYGNVTNGKISVLVFNQVNVK